MWFTLPLDVIWKHHMGERHWTFPRLVAHTLVIPFALFFLMLMAFPDLFVPSPGHDLRRETLALQGFLLLMWIFGLANLWEIRRRRKAGIQWHTYYRGKPRFLPNKPIVRCLIIPVGSGLMAYGFYRLFPPLGIYLFVMAALQFVSALDSSRTSRVEKMDHRDREIDLDNKTDELADRQRQPLEIVRVATPPKRTRLPETEAEFATRWKKVLKSSDSPKT